mmetsp:Transcript_54178/g.131476  ORF Transcript_54178/g.131476 Transcript_54178/m.131476 type:complete len:209 (-) Transcript_54178:897-1523(-)
MQTFNSEFRSKDVETGLNAPSQRKAETSYWISATLSSVSTVACVAVNVSIVKSSVSVTAISISVSMNETETKSPPPRSSTRSRRTQKLIRPSVTPVGSGVHNGLPLIVCSLMSILRRYVDRSLADAVVSASVPEKSDTTTKVDRSCDASPHKPVMDMTDSSDDTLSDLTSYRTSTSGPPPDENVAVTSTASLMCQSSDGGLQYSCKIL